MNSVKNTLIGMVTFNQYSFTYLALESLYKNTPGLRNGTAKLIVIDNNSKDSTVENIKRDFPWVKQIIVSDKDCMPYQWNQFVDLLKDDEDFCMVPNDVVFGPNWLELLQEDTYRYDNVICGSPYMPVDLAYDSVINEEWSNRYMEFYGDIRNCDNIANLQNYLDILYGDFDEFCLDFQRRNNQEPPIDYSLTHILLFKNKLFKEHNFRFCEEYCPYYGSHEFDMMVELNNLNYFRISSSRSYVHHWISITNRPEKAENERRNQINKNNLHLLAKWDLIKGSVSHSDFPMPSTIRNHRSNYYKWQKRTHLLPDEQAKKVPGIKFMCFEGIVPGKDYFSQIQPGSIISREGKSYKVYSKTGNVLELEENVHRMVQSLSVNEKEFKEEGWSISYYFRQEEEDYHGPGHMNFLLESK